MNNFLYLFTPLNALTGNIFVLPFIRGTLCGHSVKRNEATRQGLPIWSDFDVHRYVSGQWFRPVIPTSFAFITSGLCVYHGRLGNGGCRCF